MAMLDTIKYAAPGVMLVRVSVEAECAETRFCFSIASGAANKHRFCECNDLFVDDSDRVFTVVEARGNRWFMHAITGSLYDMTSGECLTSPLLRMDDVGINPDKARGKKILMSKRAAWMSK